MFKKKKIIDNNKQANDQEIINKLDQDLLVRNMPSIGRLNGSSYVSTRVSSEQSNQNTFKNSFSPKHNFKLVGLFIIIGGAIFIIGLAYLSYIYIIKPQISKTVVPSMEPIATSSNISEITEAQREAPNNSQIIATSTSLIATVTPVLIDLATSSASSTMSEELPGKQDLDLSPLIDSDSDGINDEEELIFGTNPNEVDTNSNNYDDLTEINNNYDPAGKGKIETSASFKKYINSTFIYEILYPKDWGVELLSGETTLIFTAPDDSIVQISVQENTDKQSIIGWYGESFPETSVTYDNIKITASWDGIMNSDGSNFYLTDKKKNNIYVISYIPAVAGRLTYPNTFKMMINSLLIK